MGARRHGPAGIDTVSGLRGDAFISEDTLTIDLTSCRNDPLALVKDHCLSGLASMHSERRVVTETIPADRKFTYSSCKQEVANLDFGTI